MAVNVISRLIPFVLGVCFTAFSSAGHHVKMRKGRHTLICKTKCTINIAKWVFCLLSLLWLLLDHPALGTGYNNHIICSGQLGNCQSARFLFTADNVQIWLCSKCFYPSISCSLGRKALRLAATMEVSSSFLKTKSWQIVLEDFNF